MPIIERFQELYAELIREGRSSADIYQALGKDSGTLSRWLSGKRAISESMALLIESKFGYRKEWILTGELPKKIDRAAILGEVARISKQGRDLDKVPEIRDALPNIIKLKSDEYQMLVALIYKFIKK